MNPSAPCSRRDFLAASTLIALSARAAPAQGPAEPPVILEAPVLGFMGMGPVFSVARVDPDGTARIQLSRSLPREYGRSVASMLAEGYYLLLAPTGKAAGQVDVIRARVTDVAEGPEFTVATSAEAAPRIKPGDGYTLVRPVGATTARMRSLPGVIPLESGQVEPSTADQLFKRLRSINNLKQIGLAMHNFHSTTNQFPAAVIRGPDGKPWHSWRVLILPYIEQAELFNQYDFNQPWDSEKNRKLIPRMPDVYRDPAYGAAKGSSTHYAALVGPRAFFPPDGAKQPSNVGSTVPMDKGGRQIMEITDGTSNTMCVAPVDPAREIPWTKPEDIHVGPDFPGLGKPGGIATPYTLGGKPGAPGTAPVLYADGSVHVIVDTISPKVLANLLTYNGGELTPNDAVPRDTVANRPTTKVLKIRIAGGKATATIE